MLILEEVKEKFLQLKDNVKDKIYDDIDLTVEQQTYERGKPKPYLELTCELFCAINGKNIVEIGCMREPLKHPITEMHPKCCNDGHSTYFWCNTGGNVYSVDIDKNAVKKAKKHIKKFKNCNVVCDDGIRFIENFENKIDLLFLDAWDVIPNTKYAENHLLVYEKAKPNLNDTHIISIDDTDIGNGGKGRLLIPVLISDGYEILAQGRQTIALKE